MLALIDEKGVFDMINIFSKLQYTQHLTSSEQIVAQYILNNPEHILDMNAKQIADACFVSINVIYRLCDKLNLDGFSDLKVRISQSLNDFLKQKNEVDYNFPIKEHQTHYEILSNLKESYQQTLLSTFQLFDLDEMRHVVHQMKKAHHICIYTSSSNSCFAENFKIQMREIGVLVEVPIDEYQQRLAATTSHEHDFAIIISYGGQLINIDLIAHILKEKKTPILLISSCHYQLKEEIPYYHLYLSSHEHRYKKISSFSSKLSLLYVLDALYSCFFELDYQKNLKQKIDYYQSLIHRDDFSDETQPNHKK